ncbi:VOC family protein [Mycobacteroides abscessus]
MGSTEIVAAEPQLFVTDLERAVAFYVDKLGFEVAFTYGEPAFYGQVRRGGASLNLRKVSGPVFDGNFLAHGT